MKLNQLTHKPGAKKRKMRVGRGIGSGKGKTSGRGVKGQKARTGVSGIRGFEGGQTPLYRILPKLGFSNRAFADRLTELSLERLQEAIDTKLIDTKGTIDEDALVKAKVIRRKRDGVKLLGGSALKSKVTLKITKATKSAQEAVKKAGGSIEFIVIERKPVKREKRGQKTA
ncbi:MAG: 50S ribosomal protein L15 [Alphaproteobacteria bacterium]|nr:50S ribosomal protein L15 [Alphaproteobacteria bacterium]